MSNHKKCDCHIPYFPHKKCMDICTKPLCGDPTLLTLLAPVVYDEAGFNLCSTFTLPQITIGEVTQNFFVAYPTAGRFSVEVLDITTDDVRIHSIPHRPNCYQVFLTNLETTFALRVYDCSNQLLTTRIITGTYLPSDGSIDDVANPPSFTVDIYAPYGISYEDGTLTAGEIATEMINIITFLDGKNLIHQGLNLIGLPKVLSASIDNNTITIGISFFLKSIYYAQYLIPHRGKVKVPKVEPQDDDTICMDFVNGNLMEREVKPLELMSPLNEDEYKQDCSDPNAICEHESINLPKCPNKVCATEVPSSPQEFMQGELNDYPYQTQTMTPFLNPNAQNQTSNNMQ